MVFAQCMPELFAGDDLIIALPPGGSKIRMVDHNGVQFAVVIAKVDDEFVRARLESAQRVKILPLGVILLT